MLDPCFKRIFPLKHLKKWSYWPWADYRVLRDATAVLFSTEQGLLLARKSFWLYKANERVVGYGTSAPPPDAERKREAFLLRFPHLSGQRLLLFLSRIHPKKGVGPLIDGFAAVAHAGPRLQLVIAGPVQAAWQAALQQQAAALGIAERITWPGKPNGELKWGAFRCAELFCLPSHQESFGIVVAEALACGLPVVIADPVNIWTEVADARAGLVDADTAADTTGALRRWMTLPDGEKQLMGVRGEELFRERFDFASVARNLPPVLVSAIQQQPVRLAS
jgi:glycosyltransferase involved in cell wall biosynthesis